MIIYRLKCVKNGILAKIG